MNLVTPKCPSCGAELAMKDGRPAARCAFCQKPVLVETAATCGAPPTDNFVMLAQAATEAGNLEEAARLWSRVLESDPKSVEAWLGKAKAIPMTIATMQRGYEQAESYCKRALESAADPQPVKKEVFAILSQHLLTMTMAARSHFEEFWEVEGAAQEHLGQMFEVLDGYDRLAALAESSLPHVNAVEVCDWLLARVFGKVPGLRKEIEGRRRRHIEKGGPLLADTAANEAAATAGTTRVRKAARATLGAAALIVVTLSFVGWGRWAGNASTAPETSVASGTSSPPAPTTPAAVQAASPAVAVAGTRAIGLPQTVSIAGDSTWTVLDIIDQGQALTPVRSGKNPQRTSGRWIVVHYEATNDGNTEANSPPDPRIVDAKGRSVELWSEESYDTYLRGTVRVLGTEDVKPGLKRDYWAIFEVPPGAPIKLRLHAMQGKGIRDVDVRFEGDPAPAPSASAKPKPAAKAWAKGNLDLCSQQCAAECGTPGGPCNRDCMMAHCY